MKYQYSSIDKKIENWFESDPSNSSLKEIHIYKGEIRGLQRLRVEFQFPLTAIAGKNGAGKSTILALAACAFHYQRDRRTSLDRKNPYYTFSDFFIQSVDEIPLEGIEIVYGIFSNQRRSSERLPNGVGLMYQRRKKKKGGRWNNYDRRVHRPVVYLGIDRILPHSEKSVSRCYSKLFKSAGTTQDWISEVCSICSRILLKPYNDVRYAEYGKYRLPLVTQGCRKYSGFNMGAGEDALIELLYHVVNSPQGTLILVDEIELGLHPEAQQRLILELKQLAIRKKHQMIFTTHSPWIIESLPPAGRLFIERVDEDAICIPQISSSFALGKLLGKKRPELTVLVEDEVSETILIGSMDGEQRQRVSVVVVGSAVAIARHLAMRYISNPDENVVACFDGDKRAEVKHLIQQFNAALEVKERIAPARVWVENRCCFLPGSEWPEKELVSNCIKAEALSFLASRFVLPEPNVSQALTESSLQNKHEEIRYLASKLSEKEDVVLRALVDGYFLANLSKKNELAEFIGGMLE